MADAADARPVPAEEVAFRTRLVEDGAVEEILRTLVGLGEKPEREQIEALQFLVENLGMGTMPSFVQPRPGMRTASYEVVQENYALKARVAELRAELKQTREEIEELLPEGVLTVSNIAAFGVPAVDRGGTDGSDPFVRISLLDVPNLEEDVDVRALDPLAFSAYCDQHRIAAQTSAIGDAEDPVWEGEVLEITLPGGTARPPRVLVRLWDDDVTKSDDPIASLEVQLEKGGGEVERLKLKGRGDLPDVEISFTYVLSDAPQLGVS